MTDKKYSDPSYIVRNIYPKLEIMRRLEKIDFWTDLSTDPLNPHQWERAKLEIQVERKEIEKIKGEK